MTNVSSRFAIAALLFSAAPLFAQTKAPAKPGGLTWSADNQIIRSNGIRLEGVPARPAKLHLPQLDVSAQVLAFDIDGSTISEVRAITGVNLKMDLVPKGGGAPAHIEATCTNAKLTTADRKLVLTGNLKGFYQIKGGPKNLLSGDSAVLTYVDGNLVADLNGGVSLVVPGESLGRPDAIGDVTITADRAHVNQNDGSATFTGSAHAVSKGGPNGFDVTAPQFVLTRSPDGAIGTLKTMGRTLAKFDLPPDPTPAVVPPPTVPETAPAAGTATKTKTPRAPIGKPTHVEVSADGATIDRATSTGTFDGNVKGFYRLVSPAGTQDYNFVGSRAVLTYVAPAANAPAGNALSGLTVHVTGVPVTVEGPAFDLGF